MHLTVTPAYGRDYKSKKDCISSLVSGQDWILQPQGRYANLDSFSAEHDSAQINYRYSRLTKVGVVTLGELRKLAKSPA